MYQTLFFIHITGAYLIAAYALFTYRAEQKLGRLEAGTDEYFAANAQALRSHRAISLIALLTFLIGGYLGSPFFKAGALWIFLKLGTFVALMAVMGIMGGKGLKKRAAGGSTEIAEGDRKMGALKHVQLILVVLLFLLAYLKPF